MTDILERYKLAAEKYRFLVHLWVYEERGCECDSCQEMVDAAEELVLLGRGISQIEKEGSD